MRCSILKKSLVCSEKAQNLSRCGSTMTSTGRATEPRKIGLVHPSIDSRYYPLIAISFFVELEKTNLLISLYFNKIILIFLIY